MATEAKLAHCDNIVSASSLAPPAVLIALSDIPPDSRSVGRDLTLEQDAAQRNWSQLPPFAANSSGLGASRACNPLLSAS
jgi:hypothetical protein